MENGPVTSFVEQTYSPYFKYLALGVKALTLNKVTDCAEVLNELDFSELCQDKLKFIDMPSLTGAVHI